MTLPIQPPEIVSAGNLRHHAWGSGAVNYQSKDVPQLTTGLRPFRNTTGSLRGYTVQFHHPHDGDREFIYVVKSYETPIYVCQLLTNHWYGTSEKFSQTTSRHQSMAAPLDKPVTLVNTALLRRFAEVGFRYMSAVRVIRGEKV